MDVSPVPMEENEAVERAPRPPTPVLVEWFVRDNCFYVLSALLVMLGCYQLMPESEEKGTGLWLTLKAALILQSYEWLVIAAAALIAWRMRILGDAGTLLLIALALMLDPTFFSNSFFTMPDERARLVNIVCFALVPVKLIILGAALRVRFSPSMIAAMLVAGAAVYLGGGPLTLDQIPLGLTHARYYYILAWAPALLAIVMPECARMARIGAQDPNYSTEAQRRRLRRFLLFIPLAVTAFHIFEVAQVHWVRFYPLHLVPLAVAIGVLTIKNGNRNAGGASISGRCLLVDLFSLIALVLSTRTANWIPDLDGISSGSSIYSSSRTLQLPHEFAADGTALFIGGLSVIAMYLYFYRRLDHRPALYRAGTLAAIGLMFVAWKVSIRLGAVDWAAGQLLAMMSAISGAGDRAGQFVELHPYIPAGFVWLAMLALAIRFANYGTWALCGISAIVLLGSSLPGPAVKWMPELIQCAFVLALVLNHRFTPQSKAGRGVFALVIVAIGFSRFVHQSAAWTASIAAAEFIALIMAGYFLRTPSYWACAGMQSAAFGVYGLARAKIEPAMVVVWLGLGLFAVGLGVTFLKERLLRRFEPIRSQHDQTPDDQPQIE